MSGFDLTTIDGIGVDTAAVILSELALICPHLPMKAASFIPALAPNLSISAGKRVPGKFKAVTSTRSQMHCAWLHDTAHLQDSPWRYYAVLPGARALGRRFAQPANWLNSSSA